MNPAGGRTAYWRAAPSRPLALLCSEGFRLFFPLSALYAAAWPLLWVLALEFDLPAGDGKVPSLWHANEMLIGAYGAALIGFVTTAAPEWTDTEPPCSGYLLLLAMLWAIGRASSWLSFDGAAALGAASDIAWLTLLMGWLVWLSWRRRSDRLLAFVFWLCLLIASTATARVGTILGDAELASLGIRLLWLAYLGLLGLALGRITVPITNLVLDPSEGSTPFRPHPGRLHLASGLVLVAMVGELLSLSPAVSGFLIIAVGAGFMDRVAEGFIGRHAFRAEILMLAGSSALAGLGLILIGTGRLGADLAEPVGLHVALMGGLGLGVYAVFCIAGLLHTNRPLGVPILARLGAVLLLVSVALRIAPDMGANLPGPIHLAASIGWSVSFLLWLVAYWPALTRPAAEQSSPTAPSMAAGIREAPAPSRGGGRDEPAVPQPRIHRGRDLERRRR
ncbi:MAG: NnrS family protein [Pseudomonadota bacterium]